MAATARATGSGTSALAQAAISSAVASAAPSGAAKRLRSRSASVPDRPATASSREIESSSYSRQP